MSRKSFFIGFGKTGTTTIHNTLLDHGIRSNHSGRWPKWIISKNKNNIDQFDSYQDGMSSWHQNGKYNTFEWLESEFDSFFVLNTRNLKSWLVSWWNWKNWRNQQPEYLKKKGLTHIPNDKHSIIKLILNRNIHHYKTIEYFKDKHNFMLLDIEKEPDALVLSKLTKITATKITKLKTSLVHKTKQHYIKNPGPVTKALSDLGITEEYFDEPYIDKLL